jgi:SAM-dependent methyltransferase
MDASDLDFQPESFDTVVNYLGLEDIHMTRGREGIENTFKEVFRVLKPGGLFYMVVMPPDEMETPAQRLEVEVFSHICQATWLNTVDYVQLLKDTGFLYKGKEVYYTGLKLNVKQSREEIKYACDNVSRNYGVKALDFETVWEKYKSKIKLHGMGHYTKTVLMKAKKPE